MAASVAVVVAGVLASVEGVGPVGVGVAEVEVAEVVGVGAGGMVREGDEVSGVWQGQRERGAGGY